MSARMEEIWGSRPDEWDPSRHLQARRTDKTLGVYADLYASYCFILPARADRNVIG